MATLVFNASSIDALIAALHALKTPNQSAPAWLQVPEGVEEHFAKTSTSSPTWSGSLEIEYDSEQEKAVLVGRVEHGNMFQLEGTVDEEGDAAVKARVRIKLF